jgi:hypothetical protein
MVSTIFFDGFGPWGGEHVGEIDPVFWEKSSNVSLSEYRTDRSNSTVNGTVNGTDFMGHTFGATVKLNSYSADGDITSLKAKNFPTTFLAGNTAFGLGFFINKLSSDSTARPIGSSLNTTNYASKFLTLHTTISSQAKDVLKFEVVHLTNNGYPITNPETGIKVSQYNGSSYEDMGTFTFNVWGAPWYTEQNPNTVSTTLQRTITAYDYKYGGLYVEICTTKDADTTAGVTATLDDNVSSGSVVVILSSISGLSVGMAVVSGTIGVTNNTVIQSIDTGNRSVTLSSATTSALTNGSSLGFTNKTYAVQIKVNGMHLTKYGTVTDKKIYLKDNFNTGTKFFDSMTFYGARVPRSDSSDPLNYWSGSYNQQYMYHTYLDNIYVVGGTSDQECFLGPTTKVFNITPIAGSTVNSNSSWQAFNLVWNTNTSIEDNLKDSNGDRSYVYTETSGAILAMDMANIPSDPNYAIGGIKITNSVRKSNKDTSFINVWGTGISVSGIGSDFAVTNNQYEYKNQYLLTNPITNTNWTFSDINDGKFGIKKTS